MKELIVDSFAGGGGASLGIEMALGRSPDIAINHDREALALHAANHPETLHVPHNVWKVDPYDLTRGRPVGLLWASPDCKHFSKAKGGKPVKRNIRDLAWVVVRWAKQVRPRVIFLENVEEFRDWGPLGEDGKPCPDRRGQTFNTWMGELRRLGYRVEWRELRACDYGAPTIRKRFFLIARRDGRPIVWPKPTHGAPTDVDVIAGRKLPWRTAAEIIDWSLPCHSIFLTREEGRAVGANRPLAENTMARIAKGVKRYVLDAKRPFIVQTAHGEPRRGDGIRGADEPLSTLTGSRSEAIVSPFVTKFRGGATGQGLVDPLATVTANSFVQRPGGATPLGLVAPFMVPRYGERPGQEPRTRSVEEPAPVAGGAHIHLVAAFLAQHNTGVVGHDPGEPVSTIVGKGCTQAIVEASFLSHSFTSNTGGGSGDMREPKKTVLAGGQHAMEVRAFLTKYYGESVGQPAGDPLHTASTRARFGLVTVEIGGEPYVIADIGMRMLAPRELFRAQGFPDDYAISHGRDLATGATVPLTKTAQVRMCGNSVCPPVAAALVAANYRADDVDLRTPTRRTLPLLEAAA